MKKVLALVLAAAMTLGIAATSFAAMPEAKHDTTPVTMSINGVPQIGESVGTVAISSLRTGAGTYDQCTPLGDEVPLTVGAWPPTTRFVYHVVTVVNAYDAKETLIYYNHSNYDASVRVKGPADVSNENILKETFRWYTDVDINDAPLTSAQKKAAKTYLSFDVEFSLSANNEAAIDYKGVVVEYGVKAADVPNRSGLKGRTIKDSTGRIRAGFSNVDLEDLYDVTFNAYDDAVTYGESNFDVSLPVPVIPFSVVRFLAKNIGGKTATFVLSGPETSYNDVNAATYFWDRLTLTFNKAAFTALNTVGKHINVNTNDDAGDWADVVKDKVLNEDKEIFNFVVHRTNVTGTFSLNTDWNKEDVHVYYLPDDDSEAYEVTDLTSENYAYGDVVFTGPMGRYLITVGELEIDDDGDDEPTDEPIEGDDNGLVDEDGNQIENNPGTGSSNAISLAVAMAVVSLAAAGLVASKKASK